MTGSHEIDNYILTLQRAYVAIFEIDVDHYVFETKYHAPALSYLPEKGEMEEIQELLIPGIVSRRYHSLLYAALTQEHLRQKFDRAVTTDSSVAGAPSVSIDYELKHGEGRRWMRLILMPSDYHEDGTVHKVNAMIQDNTSDKNDAALDRLTDVYNRQYGVQILDGTLEDEDIKGRFIIVDIDFFKRVNDRLGHDKGDEVLVNFATYLKDAFGDHVIIFRLGGDEFVIVERTDDPRHRVRDLEHIGKNMRQTYKKGNRHVQVSGSIGVVEFEGPGHSFQELYSKADKALYISKERGRNCITYYDDQIELQDQFDRVILRFESAMKKEHIEVYYQPIVRSITGGLSDLEALSRWNDPTLGVIAPDRFIPALEERRLIHLLDLYVVRRVCRDIRGALDSGRTVIPVSINLSRHDFTACNIFEEIEALVHEFEIPRDLLNIEITESVLMENAANIYKEIRKFQEVGYSVWMDDFGSGFSSLNVLRESPFDLIKLDMEFMRHFDGRSRTMLIALISMAKELGIRVLAEGVETEEQLEFLRDNGCERIQGYYFSKPLKLSELTQFIKAKNMQVESAGVRVFYDRLGYIDFSTEKPLSVIEYDGEKFHCLFANKPYRDVLSELGVEVLETVDTSLNATGSQLRSLIMRFCDALEVGDVPQETTCVIHGQSVRIRASVLIRYRGKALGLVETFNLTRRAAERERRDLERISRMMHATFDAIAIENLGNQTVHVMDAGFARAKELEALKDMSIPEAREYILSTLIYPADRDAYARWTDPESKQKNIIESADGGQLRFFRTKLSNGDYAWKLHQMFYIPDEKVIIYTTRSTPVQQDERLQSVLAEQTTLMEKSTDEVLWENLMESQTINLFWKDKQRRFLGANRKFLDTYGFADVSEILGKTDEDMGWHIDDAPYKNEELAIIGTGKVSVNQPGKCNIGGVTHDILATKEPMYHDGRIVGLLGYFVQADDILRDESGMFSSIEFIDQKTKLLTMKGIMSVLPAYMDEYTKRKENFAVIHVASPQYAYLNDLYGEDVSNQVIYAYSEQLRRIVDVKGSCARIVACDFIVAMKYEDKSEIGLLAERINEAICSIHSVSGFPVTMEPLIRIKYAEDAPNLRELVDLSLHD